MLHRIFFKFLLATLLLYSCGQQNTEYVDAVLHDAESILDSNSDSALVLLGSLSQKGIDEASKAKLYLLEANAKYKSHIGTKADSAKLTEAIEYFGKAKDYRSLFQAYLARSRTFYDPKGFVGNADRAMLDCVEAKKHAELLNDNALLSLIHQEIGDIYYAKFNTKEALVNFKKAKEYSVKEGNILDIVVVYGRVGSAYNASGELDSALLYQQQAIEIMRKSDYSSDYNRFIMGLLQKSLGYTYFKTEKYVESKDAYLKAYQLLPEQYASDKNVVITLLCEAYVKLNQADSAIYYASKFSEREDESLKDKAFRSYSWYTLYKKTGSYTLALKNHEDYLRFLEIIFSEDLKASVLEVQKKYDKEQLENQYNQMLVQRLYLIIMFIIGILIGSLLIWSLIYRMKKKENELLKAHQSLDVVRRMLSKKEDELADFRDKEVKEGEIADTLAEKDEKLRELLLAKLDIARRIAQMNIVSTDNTELFMKQYRKIFNHDLMDEIDWTNISTVIDELFNGFSAKIAGKYPQLSEKDMQLCCLIRAGFKPDEISVLMNYTQNTVRVKKSRLGQKMGFTDYESFLSYIMTL